MLKIKGDHRSQKLSELVFVLSKKFSMRKRKMSVYLFFCVILFVSIVLKLFSHVVFSRNFEN